MAHSNSPDISSWRAWAKSPLPVPASPRTITELPAANALHTLLKVSSFW
ncbi:hypothetical protein [Hyella patelloides]|nr:hypothetical protein [Hyella patelloides]